MKSVKKGDKVNWNSDVGNTHGKVIKKLTKPTSIKKHKVRASKEDPQYLVKSDKTGALAAHKPQALKKSAKKKSAKKKSAKKTTPKKKSLKKKKQSSKK